MQSGTADLNMSIELGGLCAGQGIIHICKTESKKESYYHETESITQLRGN